MTETVHDQQPPRVMGFLDLALFYIVTGVSLRWIATAAAAGPGSLFVWFGAFALFYIPLALSVLELSSRHPDEGGLYAWTRRAFGDFPGFLAGWCYWTSNLPYFPAVFYFAASNALYVGGDRWIALEDSPSFFMWFAFAALALIAVLNIVGLKHARWLHNIGAYGMWVPVAIVVILGFSSWAVRGSATEFSFETMAPSFELKDMVFWAALAFAFSGSEAASFMSGEIRDPRRTIPRALVFAGAAIALCYIVGTISVLLALPPGEVNPLSGLLQAVSYTAEQLGFLWIVPVTALLITVGNIGAAGGFLAATSRLPFAAGMDHLLPRAFGELHPRWGTPHVAILTQAVLGGVFVFLGQAGTSVQGAYDVLVSMGIITAFIPFLFVFLALIKMQGEPAGPDTIRIPGGRPVAILVACVGLVVTSFAIILAMLPAADEPHPVLAMTKIIGLSALLIGAGWAIYAASKKRAKKA
ncbi:APC family permease [Stakelama tenebrarum]|uniref:APC family permease n=1 Tax=Stakelama tenebrarum TaxID=2711215 RepID=A0A6G6Y6F9_9SPHN|nr:APC family permease [Sphingosinithalassobacter tenebrarum]QIG80166.1 APC family permease [Sphingosinithalassobacter tenebrarum]